jgi:hypothetical protein
MLRTQFAYDEANVGLTVLLSAPPELSDAHTAVFYIMFHQTVYNISLHKGIYLTCTILGTIKKIVIQIVLGFCG